MNPDETVRQSEEEREQSRDLSLDAPSIEGYDLVEALGEGAFGVVWSARQKRTQQEVAVKVLRPESHNWSYVQHELAKLRQISGHPNVVSLLDADLKHEPPFFVMPLLEGSLAQQSSPELSQTKRWLHQIVDALCYMHGKGVLHCDLKPSNVLLDSEGRSRVVDFGQARAAGEEMGAFGTLGYMPPEQAQGSASPDARWDVYAFGATAYRLLTGTCPRLSEDDRTKLTRNQSPDQRLELYVQVIGGNALVPVRNLNPEVDEDLATIVESCLKLEPTLRPQSMLDVREDLRRRKTREPLLCQKPWGTRYKLNRFLARPLVALMLCAAVLFPIFVNSYLTIHAQLAIRDLVLKEISTVNRMAARSVERGTELEALRGGPFQHHLLEASNVVASSSTSPPTSLDTSGWELEGEWVDSGFYTRDGVRMIGSRSKVGNRVLVTERTSEPAFERSRYLLRKNWLLNIMTLLIAAITVIFLMKPRDEE